VEKIRKKKQTGRVNNWNMQDNEMYDDH